MISIEDWDMVLICHGCESKCTAGFNTTPMSDCEIECPTCGTWLDQKLKPSKVTAYMDELKKCRKLSK